MSQKNNFSICIKKKFHRTLHDGSEKKRSQEFKKNKSCLHLISTWVTFISHTNGKCTTWLTWYQILVVSPHSFTLHSRSLACSSMIISSLTSSLLTCIILESKTKIKQMHCVLERRSVVLIFTIKTLSTSNTVQG